jgi:homoserine O-acetyltransferase
VTADPGDADGNEAVPDASDPGDSGAAPGAPPTAEVLDLGHFEFECGESIPRLEVAYESYGDPTNPTVLVCHALTGGPTVATPDGGPTDQARGWWDPVVGPGKYVDTDRFHVLCANVPGSCYGSTGPASTNPETGRPYGPAFPPVAVGDWVRAQALLLDELGIDRLHAAVGGSLGGATALEWAARFPERVDRVVPVATAARLDPQLLALSATARRAVTTDPDWNGGRYYGRDPPNEGLAQARRIGHVTYLSKESMAERFGRRPAAERDTAPADPTGRDSPYRAVESYLDYNAERFAERFDANAFLYLSRAMENYDLGGGRGGDAAALDGFSGVARVIAFEGDWHYPPERSRELADAFRRGGTAATHEVIESGYGHDAFLVEPGRVGPLVADALDTSLPARGAPVHAGLFR